MKRYLHTKIIVISIGFLFLFGCNTHRDKFNLTLQNYEIWRDFIKPTDIELVWASIPWRSSFQEGLIEANAQKKPLLLWAMNGHPLGCTWNNGIAGRRSVWSDSRIINIAKEFIPTTDEVWRLQRVEDKDAIIFQEMANTGHYRRAGGTRQGMDVQTSSISVGWMKSRHIS